MYGMYVLLQFAFLLPVHLPIYFPFATMANDNATTILVSFILFFFY